MAKRGGTGLSFVICINKPAGMTSHDVVNRVRRAYGERRVGHFGTLDPLAEGVMLVGVGPAARLDAFLVEHGKDYVARIVFGEERDTDDAEGEVLSSSPVPTSIADAAYAQGVLDAFVGEQMQVPPVYSAIKHSGVSAHALARAGKEVVCDPRSIEVFEAKLLSLDGTSWTVAFSVSKGTYIRALARDIGRRVGCGAYLGALLRERLGEVTRGDCMSLEDLDAGNLRILDPVRLLGYPVFELTAEQEKRVANGNDLPLPAPLDCMIAGSRISVVCDNRLRAIYRVGDGDARMVSECVFAVGVQRV